MTADSSISEGEREVVDEFLSEYFPAEYTHEASDLFSSEIQSEEQELIQTVISHADEHFQSSKGTLGLALDFIMVAEQLSQKDGYLADFDLGINQAKIFDRYDQKATKSTLTFKHKGESYAIRSVHNEVIDFFRNDLDRTNFPSSPGHHTGEWDRYDDMLEMSFKLSRKGRYEAAQRLIAFGLEELGSRTPAKRVPPFPQTFESVLADYSRKDSEEQGGSAYQALAYGYVKTKWPHLSLRASKVRTGSSRQHRYGDIDGYMGPDLMVSVEVKDMTIDEQNVRSQLGSMIELSEKTTAIVVAMCKEIESGAKEILHDEGVQTITDSNIDKELETWDYHKQNRAVQGMVHFFAHIEENPSGTQRLLKFVKDIDPDNPALAHLKE